MLINCSLKSGGSGENAQTIYGAGLSGDFAGEENENGEVQCWQRKEEITFPDMDEAYAR